MPKLEPRSSRDSKFGNTPGRTPIEQRDPRPREERSIARRRHRSARSGTAVARLRPSVRVAPRYLAERPSSAAAATSLIVNPSAGAMCATVVRVGFDWPRSGRASRPSRRPRRPTSLASALAAPVARARQRQGSRRHDQAHVRVAEQALEELGIFVSIPHANLIYASPDS